MKKLINFLLALFRYLLKRYRFAKATVAMEKVVKKQAAERVRLRLEINHFLKEYFGIDAKSKYIPKKFKNGAEVKEAICAKFDERMADLNLSYQDLFK